MLDKTDFTLQESIEEGKGEFDNLRGVLENHLSIEDEAIFSLFERFSGKNTEDVFNLMEQHSQIEGLLNNANMLLEKNQKPDLNELKELLKKHSAAESEVFYKDIDEKLSEIEREVILKKLLDKIGKSD